MRLQEGKRYLLMRHWKYGSSITKPLGTDLKPDCLVGQLMVLSPMGFHFDLGMINPITFVPTEDKDILRGLDGQWVVLDPIDFKNP